MMSLKKNEQLRRISSPVKSNIAMIKIMGANGGLRNISLVKMVALSGLNLDPSTPEKD